ncbi:MAG TPA: SRPBCC domain-containing protein [Solirubrobacterales bacterium]|nr:SRPBCC domain-containing protein [Solirubrobacterales bacterium]
MSTLAHTVTRSVVLDAPPAEVWEAITDEGQLSEWLAPEVELDPQEGGEVVCRFEDGEERRGEVELVEEAERLAFRWWREGAGPSRVEFVVDAVAEGTRLTVIESGLVPNAAPLLAAGWAPRLRALRLQVGRLVLA